MNGSEFLRRVKKLGKAKGVAVSFDTKQGKGSHGTLIYGSGRTTLKDRKKEIGQGLLSSMLDQLGIKKDDFDAA
jgi:mRNA interferase HicA